MANGPTVDNTGVHVDTTAYTVDGGGSATVAPTITVQPASQITTAGAIATFSVTATGAITGYQWYRNGVVIPGAVVATYSTAMLSTGDSGSTFYVVVANNSATTASNPATLIVTVGPAVVITPPASTTVLVGQSATFTVGYSGTVTGFQWYENGSAIPAANAQTYTTPPTSLADSGETFYVALSNAGGTTNSAVATLAVNPTVTAGIPIVLVQPMSARVLPGQSATFVIAAAGSITSYQWLKNGNPISGATSAAYTTPATGTADNNSAFSVVVTGPLGSTTSGVAFLYIVAAKPPLSNLIWTGILPGMLPQVSRSYIWATNDKEALSGKETRIQLRQYPRVQFEFQYELLRDNIALSELRRLFGIFNAAAGSFGTFLFNDLTFNSVQEQWFGVGDGSTTAFQLVATFANNGETGGNEIIQNLQATPAIYLNGAATTAFTLGPTGIITFSSPPALNVELRWTGGFYYRVRFTNDTMNLKRFMVNWWESGAIQLISVKL